MPAGHLAPLDTAKTLTHRVRDWHRSKHRGHRTVRAGNFDSGLAAVGAYDFKFGYDLCGLEDAVQRCFSSTGKWLFHQLVVPRLRHSHWAGFGVLAAQGTIVAVWWAFRDSL